MLKYLNLAALLPSAKCYQKFISSTWEIVWGLITRWFYTHDIIHEVQKERKMIFFPALTLDKASGLAEIPPFCCKGLVTQAWVLAELCAYWSRDQSLSWSCTHTSDFLPKGLLTCQNKDPYSQVGDLSSKRKKRVRVASCINWGCFLSSLGSGPFLASVWQALLLTLGTGRCTTLCAAAGSYAEMVTCSKG